MSLFDITRFLDTYLGIHDVPDSSNNGLQVQGSYDVKKIAFAVDACQESFEKARVAGAQLLIVHHGLSWGGSLNYITSLNASRLKFLLQNGISLYTAHLPLDLHLDVGNNVQLFRLLGLQNTRPFGHSAGVPISLMGELASEMSIEEFEALVEKKLGRAPCTWKFGPKRVRKVTICSGSGGSELAEAVARRADVYLTGEVHHSSYHAAKEGKINVVAAGHYATETLGVKALMPVLKEKFGVDVEFVEADTGL